MPKKMNAKTQKTGLRHCNKTNRTSRFHLSAIFYFFSIANLSSYLDTFQDLLNRKNQILQKYETELVQFILLQCLKEKKFFVFSTK
jgi:hypothetical protein